MNVREEQHLAGSEEKPSRATPINARHFGATLWILLYLSLAAFPLLILLIGPVPKGGGRLWDFAMGLGFSGLAMMGLQFVLTARFRRIGAPFGIDILYYFHRWAAIAGFTLILVHYAILRFNYPESLSEANPFTAPWHMTAGRAAILMFLLLIISSICRKELKIEYDRWHVWHALLAVAGVALAMAHIEGVGYYTRAAAKKAAWITFSLLWLVLLAHIRIFRPWLLCRRRYSVVSVTPERGNAWSVTVEPQGGHSLNFRPGQFAWLSLGSSPFHFREHPFSFSGSAENRNVLQFTIKELGDFTRTVKDVKPGSIAYVDGPYGAFTPDLYPNAAGFVFIAGGVGIAPIMCILRTFADRGEQREVQMIYGNSTWERVLFREEIERVKSRLNLKVQHVLSHPPADWPGETGILTEDVLTKALSGVRDDFIYFVCGPKGMIKSAERALRGLGVPLWRIHFEHFDMA